MTHVTCRLTAKNRDQLRNPTLGNTVWATFLHTYLLTYCEGDFVEVATVNVDTNIHTYIRIYIAPKIVRTNLRFLTQPTCRAPALRIARRTRWRLPARGPVDHAEERAAGDSRDAGPTALRLSRVCTLQQPRSISQRASFSSPDARRKQLPHLLLPPPPLLLLLPCCCCGYWHVGAAALAARVT